MQTLEALPWTATGSRGGHPVYEISFRACPPCIIFARDGAGQLGRLGLEVRTILFAPSPATNGASRSAGPGEMAALAALYRTRDPALLHDWFYHQPAEGFASARGLPPVAPGSPELRQINQVRTAVRSITAALEAAGGITTGYPAFFWTDPVRGARYAQGWGRGVPQPLQDLAQTVGRTVSARPGLPPGR
jgi:hypothetical protein